LDKKPIFLHARGHCNTNTIPALPYLSKFAFMTLKKILLTACFCGCLASALAQQSDILMLQKHQRTITNYYAGSNISFFTTDRMPVSGVIDSLKRDSLFLTQYDVRRFMTAQGASYIDTTGKFRMAFSVASIGYFPYTGRQPQSFWGRLLMLGGGGFLLVNMVNTLRVNEPPFGKDNLPRVLGALGAVALGAGLLATQKDQVKLGGKYRLKYLSAQ